MNYEIVPRDLNLIRQTNKVCNRVFEDLFDTSQTKLKPPASRLTF